MLTIKYLVLLCGLAVSTSSFALTFEKTLSLYANKNFEPAYNSFYELSVLGNTKAQLNVAVMYARGEFVKVNRAESLAWAKLALNNGEEAAEKIFKILEKSATPEQKKQYLIRYEKLANQFENSTLKERLFPTSSNNSSSFKQARPIEKKQPKYPKSSRYNGDFGYVDLTAMIGTDGSVRFPTIIAGAMGPFEINSIEAFKSFKYEPASMAGTNITSFGTRNRFIFQMAGTKIKPEKMQPYLNTLEAEAAAGTGIQKYSYVRSIQSIKKAFSNTKGYEEIDWGDNFDWLYQSAQEGVAIAKFELGLDTLDGNQCDEDVDKSLIWLSSAAKDGFADAQMILGYEMILGKRFNKDEQEGFVLLDKAAKNLDHAKVMLAWFYSTYPNTQYQNYSAAQEILSTVDTKSYTDLRSYYEALAATALGNKDYKIAKKALKKLAKQNEVFDTPKDRELALQASLKSKITYTEAL